MAKYTGNLEQLKTREQVEAAIAGVIENETGAAVEVTVRAVGLLIYTEDLDRKTEIIHLMEQAGRTYLRFSEYEADDDMPAGITLFFAI